MDHRAGVLDRSGGHREADPARTRFRRSLVVGLLTIVAPGSAQLLLGSRWLGRIALGIWLLLVAGAVGLAWTWRTDRARVLGWFTDPDVVGASRLALLVLAVAWLGLFVDSWRLAAPWRLRSGPAGGLAVLYLVVITLVVGATGATARLMEVQQEVVETVFSAEETSTPLEGRYNILLVGADSGADRSGLRPDSLMVASIDTETGRTVLVSLPRNLQNVPFPVTSPLHDEYPDGYDCGGECLLNAVYLLGVEHADEYPGVDDPGLQATQEAVEATTGLGINYHIVLNMEGFSSLVDAVGGVEVTVRSRIAKFGRDNRDKTQFIQPGRRTLNGEDALWYARSRVQSDDYTRMARQKCLLAAMMDQLDPQTVVFNATEIGESSKELFTTNIPGRELGLFADLVLKSRDTPITTVSLVPPLVDVTDPDYDEVRDLVAAAIDPWSVIPDPEVTVPSPTPTPTPTAPGAMSTPDTSQIEANTTDDLEAAC